MPLKGIAVRLQSISIDGKIPSIYSGIEMHDTTDEDGKFTFGYVPPGVYALGCSYKACYTAFRKIKHSMTAPDQNNENNAASEEPVLQLSVDACEGMVCKVAIGKMIPDDWSSNTTPTANTHITKEWSNAARWLQAGGGVRLKINSANTMISGTIEAR